MSEKNEGGTTAIAPPSHSDWRATTENLPFSASDVNKSLGLKCVLDAISAKNRDVTAAVCEVFPSFNRQLLTQCTNWEKYGVILHPAGMKKIEDTFVPDIKKPKKPNRRRNKQVTFRVILPIYEKMLESMALHKFSTIQNYIEFLVLEDLKEMKGEN